jgi:hypothetical protein
MIWLRPFEGGSVVDNTPSQSIAVQRFWKAFQGCVEENRAEPARAVYYVKWAQEFSRFIPTKVTS